VRIGWILLALTLCGCEALRPDPGRIRIVAAAAHAGQFQRATGRWPASRAELEAFPCPNLDDAGFPAANPHAPQRASVCDFLAGLSYRIDMAPRRGALVMEFRDAGAHRICTLRVLAPSVPAGTALAPQSIIRTGLFSCPGADEEDR